MNDSRYRDAKTRLNALADSNSSTREKVAQQLKELLGVLDQNRSAALPSQRRERQEIEGRMAGFNPKLSKPFQRLTEKGYGSLKFSELRSLGEIISKHVELTLDRQAKRRKEVFFKWLDENWEKIEPVLDRMQFRSDPLDQTSPES